MAVLRDLHRGRNRRPIADTIARLLAATRAHAGVAIWPTGEQALANVTRLIDMARRAERHGVTSFRGFVDRLAAEAERGEASDAPIVEEGTGRRAHDDRAPRQGPRVPGRDPRRPDGQGGARRAEPLQRRRAAGSARCASPAARRPSCSSIATTSASASARRRRASSTWPRRGRAISWSCRSIGDERREGWLGALHPVVYPDESRRRQPEAAQPAGCPRFGLDSVR